MQLRKGVVSASQMRPSSQWRWNDFNGASVTRDSARIICDVVKIVRCHWLLDDPLWGALAAPFLSCIKPRNATPPTDVCHVMPPSFLLFLAASYPCHPHCTSPGQQIIVGILIAFFFLLVLVAQALNIKKKSYSLFA